jgi:hypothetical protein
VSESAVVSEAKGRSTEASEDVEIGSLSCKRKGQSRERALAIESGAAPARASEEMGDGFQTMKFTLILLDTVRGRLTSGFLSRRSQQSQCIGDD